MSRNTKKPQNAAKQLVRQVSAEIHDKLQQAVAWHKQGELDLARRLYDDILHLNPRQFDALHLSGVIARQRGDFLHAVKQIGLALKLDPDHAQAHNNLGNALSSLKDYRAAVQSYDHAVLLKPDYAEAFNHRGNALKELSQFEAALRSYEAAIAINPAYAEAYFNRGNLLMDFGQPAAALADYDRAIAHKADFAVAWNNRGNALKELRELEAAGQSYLQAVSRKPDYAEAYNNLGNIHDRLQAPAAALQAYEQAIAADPDYANAYFNRGNCLFNQRRFESARQSYDKAIALMPAHAEAYNNRGNTLGELADIRAAIESYDKAIELSPDFAEALVNRGNALKELKQYRAALQSYELAMQIQPDLDFIHGQRLHALMNISDWRNIDELISQLRAGIQEHKRISNPFTVLALTGDPVLQLKAAEIWRKAYFSGGAALEEGFRRGGGDKIRLGYYSADFHEHATAYLTARLFELHDKSKFEVIGFSYGPPRDDAMRGRLCAAFNEFIDVRELNDGRIAGLSRERGIDIAVDLKGYTQGGRPGIFAVRAAPIQVGYLGYPGSTGADYMDYLIADSTLIPEGCRRYYTEKVAYLPYSYQANDSMRRIAARRFSREECGLPARGFIYCCFNNNYKITPEFFGCWMRILEQTPESVLWLFQDNADAAENLRKAAVGHGVDAGRLIFAQRLPLPEHLSRLRLADLFLDTLPCNAHTTASDALWAGLPVLTCMGETFAGRVAASLLNAINLPELITRGLYEYERLAVHLAANPDELAVIRHKLWENRLVKPLFDSQLFTRHIEAAYLAIFMRSQAGLAPEHLLI